jgi:hypothetical protein
MSILKNNIRIQAREAGYAEAGYDIKAVPVE